MTHHKIRRATIDFKFNGTTDGFSFQQDVRDWFDEVIAKLDNEFKTLPVTEQIIEIDLMELEISVGARDWRDEASEKIIRQLKDRLRMMQTGQISAPGFKETTTVRQFEESFLHYLEYGYLPWPSSGLTGQQWNDQLKLLLLHAEAPFSKALIHVLLHSLNALQRFLQLVPTSFALQFIQTDESSRSPYRESIIYDLTALFKTSQVQQHSFLKQVIYRALLLIYSNEHDIASIEMPVIETLRQNMAEQVSLKERFDKIIFHSPGFIALKKSTATVHRSSGGKKKATRPNKTDMLRSQDAPDLSNDKIPEDELTSHESIFIANAGIVIVAPFLPGLFDTLRLTRNGIVMDEAKAIGVTHFLATGFEEIQEYELVLPKILCGIPVQKPITVNGIRFNKKIRTETERVLASVIAHWSVLQNTSIDGLRESFLKRNGKLYFDGSDWVLQVEQQPYDMLLQHLPWSLSMIRLPWMRHMLKTEWVY